MPICNNETTNLRCFIKLERCFTCQLSFSPSKLNFSIAALCCVFHIHQKGNLNLAMRRTPARCAENSLKTGERTF